MVGRPFSALVECLDLMREKFRSYAKLKIKPSLSEECRCMPHVKHCRSVFILMLVSKVSKTKVHLVN